MEGKNTTDENSMVSMQLVTGYLFTNMVLELML